MASPTRDRILDAARTAFATRGVDGTAITDLEEAAGLAAGSGGFYRYFRTKDEALAAVVRREIDRVLAAQDVVRPPEDLTDPRDGISELFEGGLATLRTLGPLIAILSREQGRIPELAAEISDRLIVGGMRHDMARVGALIGADDAEDLRPLGAVILSALVGYLLATEYFGAPPAGVAPEQFIGALTDLVSPLPAKERSL